MRYVDEPPLHQRLFQALVEGIRVELDDGTVGTIVELNIQVGRMALVLVDVNQNEGLVAVIRTIKVRDDGILEPWQGLEE